MDWSDSFIVNLTKFEINSQGEFKVIIVVFFHFQILDYEAQPLERRRILIFCNREAKEAAEHYIQTYW